MNLNCNKCDGSVSTRIKSEEWITLKCLCQIIIIYFDGCIITRTKEEYLQWKRERNKNV